MGGKTSILLFEILAKGLVESHPGLEIAELCVELGDLEGHCFAFFDDFR